MSEENRENRELTNRERMHGQIGYNFNVAPCNHRDDGICRHPQATCETCRMIKGRKCQQREGPGEIDPREGLCPFCEAPTYMCEGVLPECTVCHSFYDAAKKTWVPSREALEGILKAMDALKANEASEGNNDDWEGDEEDDDWEGDEEDDDWEGDEEDDDYLADVARFEKWGLDDEEYWEMWVDIRERIYNPGVNIQDGIPLTEEDLELLRKTKEELEKLVPLEEEGERNWLLNFIEDLDTILTEGVTEDIIERWVVLELFNTITCEFCKRPGDQVSMFGGC